jgi:alpha-tubulin suppressor-like RCC1 family protein
MRVGKDSDWVKISVGDGHNLALKRDGSLWSWGWNAYGQLGLGTTSNTWVPTMIGKDRDWLAMAATHFGSLALKKNRTLWGWGNGKGLRPIQAGTDTNWQSVSGYGYAIVAIKTDGTLWWRLGSGAFSSKSDFTQVGEDSDWVDARPGWGSFFARKSDGTWWVYGENRDGQLGVGMSVNIVALLKRLPFALDPWAFTSGGGTTLSLDKDGQLWTWGQRLGKTNTVIDLRPFPLWKLPKTQASHSENLKVDERRGSFPP